MSCAKLQHTSCRLIMKIFIIIFTSTLLIVESIFAETISLPNLSCDSHISKDKSGINHITAPGYDTNISPGDPALPYKEFSVIMPPGSKVENILLENAAYTEIKDIHNLAPVPPAATYIDGEYVYDWGIGKDIVDGKNKLVYDKDAFYPSTHVEVVRVGKMRKWKMARIRFYPYRYNPVTGMLIKCEGGTIKVECPRPTQVSAMAAQTELAESQDKVFDSIIAKQASQNEILNYDQAKSWYTSGSLMMAAAEAAGGDPEVYYILTTSTIVANSTKLQDFIDHKNATGFSVTVVTESAWGSQTGDAGSNAIRQYLADNYIGQNIKYVLFIGNPHPVNGDVPMKKLWPRSTATSYRDAVSDYFYADLTGNWDLDEDGLYGEAQDFGDGGIDINPEVFVGRIPFYGNFTDLDSILQKIIDYEKGDLAGPWVGKVLLSFKPFDGSTPYYQLGEEIKRDMAVPKGFLSIRVYAQNYGLDPPPEKVPCTTTNVLSAWQQYAGFHIWGTHGSTTSASGIFNSGMCPSLDNDHPSFTYQGSCTNGYPEYSSNLGYSLLKNGAIATVSATRVSWYWIGQTTFTNTSSIGGVGYRYAANLITQHLPCGEALFTTMTQIPTGLWTNKVVFVLYGDPSVKYSIDLNDPTPPTTPVVIDAGASTYFPTYLTASWSSSDPDSGIIEYQYKITEGSTAGTIIRDWTSTGLNNSVTAIGLTLVEDNSYYFGVMAKNAAGAWSDIGYSDGVVYNVDTTPPTTPTFDDLNYSEMGETTAMYANWTSSDPETGVDEHMYKITKDSIDGLVLVDWTSTGSFASFWASGLNLIEGDAYYVAVQTKNTIGLWSDIAYDSFIYVYDVTPPDISITSPGRGNICNKDFPIIGTAMDNKSTIEFVNVFINNTDWTYTREWQAPVISGQYTCSATNIPDDAYRIRVSAEDDRRNYTSKETSIVVIDQQPIGESFENGWMPWVPDNDGHAPEFIIEISQDQAYDGSWSARIYIDSALNDGTGWVERTMDLAPYAMYQINMSFQLWSLDESSVNNWGVVAYAGIQNPKVESDFTTVGETDQVAGWKEYTYQTQVRTDFSGKIYVACGITCVGGMSRSYYIDLVNITFTQVPNGSVSGIVVDEIEELPIEGINIQAFDYAAGDLITSVNTLSDGTYILNDLPPGGFRIYATEDGSGGLPGAGNAGNAGGTDPGAGGYGDEYYDNVYSREEATEVTVNSAEVTPGINFGLRVLEEVLMDLERDFNQVGFSVIPTEEVDPYNASRFILDLSYMSIPVDIVMQWDGAAWLSHQKGLPFTDYSLDPDKGIFMNVEDLEQTFPLAWETSGWKIKLPKIINLIGGWNLVAIPTTISAGTALGVLDQINIQGGTAEVMMWWDGAVWISTQAGLPFTDQAIVPGRSYFIRCLSGSTWEIE